MKYGRESLLHREGRDTQGQAGVPSCRGEFVAPVRWKVCRKRKELPRGVGEEDRRKFAKAASYMVRLDDLVACYKCRKRFELTGQSTVLISDALGDPSVDPENFGNR